MTSRRLPLALWLLAIAGCAWIVAQARFTTDMSAFLPAAATPMQRLLISELRDGVAARLILAAVEAGSPDELARASLSMGRRLAQHPEFVYVANGEARLAQADRDFLFAHRYALSPGVTREHFESQALAAALDRAYQALASPAGIVVRRYLPADPTGELLQVLGLVAGEGHPASHMGVWMSRDQRRALLLVQTASAGFDIDAQSRNLALIEQAFAAARAEAGAQGAALRLTGPAVFGVRSRDMIRSDVRRLSALAAALVALLLVGAFRSPRAVILAFVPVGTGALAGVAAVSAWFGTVHAITLGFGITLIGEAVDYAIYFFSQRSEDETAPQSLARIWPTLRLGTLVSVASFCAMLFSGFPGLAQLALFSAVGLVTALFTTRSVLPSMVGSSRGPIGVDALARILPRRRLPAGARWALAATLLGASGTVVWFERPIWDDDLARLNPVSMADQAFDQQLRAELGAPDVRLLLVVSGASREQVLERCEDTAARLGELIRAGAIAGFDSPAMILPSRRTQLARREALPDGETLRGRLRTIVAASPFRADLFEPFIRDVAAAKSAPLVEPESFRGTVLQLKLDSLLFERNALWHALLPLRGVADPGHFAAIVGTSSASDVSLLDIQRESSTLLATYRSRALGLWGVGLALIVALLYAHQRSMRRVLTVLAPLAAAVAGTTAILLLAGVKLTLFHLVALLLVVGVGSNYALFFERKAASEAESRRAAFAVVLCAATTIIAFGLLASSHLPVLKMIGATAALGAFASLVCSALVADREREA